MSYDLLIQMGLGLVIGSFFSCSIVLSVLVALYPSVSQLEASTPYVIRHLRLCLYSFELVSRRT
jgi:hypothetical protein